MLGPSPAVICSELFAVDLQAQPVFIMPLPSLGTWTPECSSSGRPPGSRCHHPPGALQSVPPSGPGPGYAVVPQHRFLLQTWLNSF